MKNLIIVVASALGIMGFLGSNNSSGLLEQLSSEISPHVELTLSENPSKISWGDQVRYSIRVSDQVDGDSKYGEIDPKRVLMYLQFYPGIDSTDMFKDKVELPDQSRSFLLGKGGCFACHADKNNGTGPSFSEISASYKNGENSREDLKNSIRTGSEGEWDGSMSMPPNPEYSKDEISQMVEYIITQGLCENCRVYSGLEGKFKVPDKKGFDNGGILLIASYESTSGSISKDSSLIWVKEKK